MAQTVNIPGVGQLQFPDGMSQDDMAAAIQKNYPQLSTPSTQAPDDSPFLKSIKGLGNTAARVGVKTVAGLPLMAMDAGVGARNMIGRATGTQSDFDLPSDSVNAALDHYIPGDMSRGGKISEGLSTLIASLGMPGASGLKVAGDLTKASQSLTGADAVKAEAMAAARNNGVVVPPVMTKNAPLRATIANGLGGETETAKLARDTNTPAINSMAAKDIGLDAQSPLTLGPRGTITGQINDAVKSGYAPLRDLGKIPVDQAHIDLTQSLGSAQRGAANIDASLGDPGIAALSRALTPLTGRTPDKLAPGMSGMGLTPKAGQNTVNPGSFDSGDIVDAISSLRSKASDAYAAGNQSLGKAYKQAAAGFESLMDRHLQNQGESGNDLLNNYRLARVRIAKSHDITDALNPATGDIDPAVLARADPGELSGGLKDIATIGKAFPKAVVPASGTPAPVTAFQSNMAPAAIGAEPVTGGLATLGNLLGRPLFRKYALGSAQNSLMQPKGATLSGKALDAVFSNPAAFGAMYEDQK